MAYIPDLNGQPEMNRALRRKYIEHALFMRVEFGGVFRIECLGGFGLHDFRLN